ncbi:MAG: thiamine pyrophosphate-dependent enzyme [Candidatus Heimdallarchaeaceae archaeon]
MSVKRKNKIDNGIAETEEALFMGNHAVVQGLLEAGVGFTAAYPGTPSTEIQVRLAKLHEKGQLYFEYSVNEKVAFEVSAAAALSGVRSAVIMKHVGVNVASDAMMALAYFGVQGGMVIVAVDDPGCQSSQNEQDSRFWGKFAHIPVFEPSTPQEIRDFIPKIYDLSEKYNMLCMLRMTNFTSLSTGIVKHRPVEEKLSWNGEFVREIKYQIPARYLLHKGLHKSLKELVKDPLFDEFISLKESSSSSERLIITHGAIYPIVEYMAELYNFDGDILKIGAIFPLNEEKIAEIVKKYKYVYFVEELEPYLETEILAIIGRNNLNVTVLGKEKLQIPYENSLRPDALKEAFSRIVADPNDDSVFYEIPDPSPLPKIFDSEELLIPRTLPRLCDGCSHRGAFYSIKKATGEDFIIPSDIGCYALGQVQPVDVGDYWLCMGGGLGTALGMSKVNGKKVIAIIGDGTFFHAGMPALLDAVEYNHNITLAILDNSLTAMTGGQPSPSSTTWKRKDFNPINLEEVVKGLGVKWIKSVQAINVKENVKIVKEALEYQGPSVLIFKGECIVNKLRNMKTPVKPLSIDQELCTRCGNCLIDFACPSIVKEDGRIIIKQDTCTGCGYCAMVCPVNAIK